MQAKEGVLIYLYGIFIAGILMVGLAHGATCPNNYTDQTGVDILATTFMAPVDGRCTNGAYEYRVIPDTFVPIYNGFTDGTAVTLCGNGYLSGNSCVQYTTGNCDTGYYNDASVNAATFMAPVDGRCTNGAYEYRTGLPDTMYPIYNGFTDGTVVTLCGVGQYLANGTTCTSYVQDDCPNNMIDITTNDEFFTKTNLGVCGTNYDIYNIHQQCDSNTTDSMCAVLCSDGLQYTDVGTCATLCELGVTTLNAKKNDGTILTWPVYSTKQITPSMAVGLNGGVCWVNLLEGAGNDALNVNYNNTTYHTVR